MKNKLKTFVVMEYVEKIVSYRIKAKSKKDAERKFFEYICVPFKDETLDSRIDDIQYEKA